MVIGRGACADTEPLLMMRPPRGVCAFITRKAAWVQKNGPFRLVSTTARHCAGDSVSNGTAGAPMPALLNSTSTRPK